MQETLIGIAKDIALIVQAGAVVVVAIGSLQALYRVTLSFFPATANRWTKRSIWAQYASWLVLGLEFALGADIIRSAIAPTWNEIGQLAAIAVIRTFLNFFLSRDIERAEALKELP